MAHPQHPSRTRRLSSLRQLHWLLWLVLAPVPYLFEGHRIRMSTDAQGEVWIVVADACAVLAESPMVWAMANRRDEEHCLHSEEGPGAGGLTLALIKEATLLRRLPRGHRGAAATQPSARSAGRPQPRCCAEPTR